ncbi:MAG TPA: Wzz/FepE/Etk N-terminal domain-containing protein [Edaphobacter sp.]|nr:Wzz/FepE/Etk N-terminal domain-containing protein [Edaphobacter sp.]
MLGHRTLTMEDYGAILKRRWWIIVIPMVVLPIIAVAISLVIPPEYLSQTLVLVEQQKVPDEYVKPVVSEDLTGRLASMKEQILSRARLTPIIERFNLFGTGKTSMDDRIDMTRKNIDIKPIRSEMTRTGGLPGFFISFKASDARTAQLVTGEITSLFVNENLKSRATSVEGTQDFLRGQLTDAKQKLDDQDAKLAAFQQKYVGRLPGEEAPNMNMLTSLNTQLDAVTQAIARMEQDKSYEEAMLAQQQSLSAQVSERGGAAPQAQQSDLQALLGEEADLTKRYTDDYPDVVAVRRKIKELRKEMAAAPPAPAPAPVSTPNRGDSVAVQQLRAQIRALEQGITQKKHDQGMIQGQIRMYQDRISSSPLVQEEYKALTRDYTTAQSFYDDLLKKMNDSKMATDLEKRQQGEQFRVMDEPNLPDGPSFPKRGVFVAAGLAAGLCLGLMIVALIEYKDTSMRNERDIWAFTKLPTLSVIAFAGEPERVKAKRGWKFWQRKPNLAAAGKPLVNTGG